MLVRRFSTEFFRRNASEVVKRVIATARDLRTISYEPAGSPNGRVLLSYLLDPFRVNWHSVSAADPLSWHFNGWECRQIAQSFLDLGYAVDIISFRNRAFLPSRDYDVFIDVRYNMERLAPVLNRNCIKIYYADIADLAYMNAAESRRLLDIQRRRRVTLHPHANQAVSQGMTYADCGLVYGNRFTMDTFRYAGKPLFSLPAGVGLDIPWNDSKDFDACRKSFIWLGSSHLVRKGLDLVLEAFAGMPDFTLYVCGAIGSRARSRPGATLMAETDFERAYHQELYELPHIHTLGWMNTGGAAFRELASKCVGMAYASSCEGQAGSVITCMHAGLIPAISYESGVDVDDFGFQFENCSVNEIRRTVALIGGLPASELQARARRTWAHARTKHTRTNFSERLSETIGLIFSLYREGRLRSPEMGVPPLDTLVNLTAR
jgi:hypothetical protein